MLPFASDLTADSYRPVPDILPIGFGGREAVAQRVRSADGEAIRWRKRLCLNI